MTYLQRYGLVYWVSGALMMVMFDGRPEMFGFIMMLVGLFLIIKGRDKYG